MENTNVSISRLTKGISGDTQFDNTRQNTQNIYKIRQNSWAQPTKVRNNSKISHNNLIVLPPGIFYLELTSNGDSRTNL